MLLVSIIIAEMAMVFVGALLLSNKVLRNHVEQRQLNRHRMDGSRSDRRDAIENTASLKLKSDIGGVLLIAVFLLNIPLLAIHIYVCDLNLVAQGTFVFLSNPEGHRQAWHDAGVVDDVENSLRSQGMSRDEARDFMRSSYALAPIGLAVGIGCMVYGLYFCFRGFQRSVREYAQGLARRRKEYALVDMRRMKRRERDASPPPTPVPG